MQEPNVLAVVLHSGQIYTETFLSIYDLIKPKNFQLSTVRGTLVALQRNTAVNNFLKMKKFTHLFFIDSDSVLPKNALIKLLQNDKDIVSGIYFMKDKPFYPVVGRKNENGYSWVTDYPQNSLIEVDLIGMGCVLIKREVLEKLLPTLEVHDGIPQFYSYVGATTEDIFFCRKAQEAGFKIFCDTSVKIGHMRETSITENHFLQTKNSGNI